MPFSMYDASVPAFVKMLQNLAAILDKAAAHAKNAGIDPLVLTSARLGNSGFPLERHVHDACNLAKNCGGRLARRDLPWDIEDGSTFPILQAHISETITFLQSLPASAFDGAENHTVTLRRNGQAEDVTGKAYLVHSALPQFYLSIATVYFILQTNGVFIRRPDFVGFDVPR